MATRIAPLSSGDAISLRLRGFGPIGLLAILVIFAGDLLFLPLSGLLVLSWVYLSRTSWREVGYVMPKSWLGGIATGVAFGVPFKLAMKALVMPLFGADPVNHTYHFLAGNTAALPGMLFAIIAGAGFGEETVFRGFMFERLGKLLGANPIAKAAIVVLTSAFFSAAHYADQGLPGVEQAAITGLVFGSIFAATGRIWMLMVAHAAFDLTAVAIIYWNLETPIAHLVFR